MIYYIIKHTKNVVCALQENQTSFFDAHCTQFPFALGITVDKPVDIVDNPALMLFVEAILSSAKNHETLPFV